MSEDPKTVKVEIMNEHLPYELIMLRGTFDQLVTHTVETNALIESFCIHARQLLDFFEDKEGRTTDARASDFTKTKYQTKHLPPSKDPIRDNINKQIAHITLCRTTDSTEKITGQDMLKLLNALTDEAEKFKKKLKPEYQDEFRWNQPQRPKIPESSFLESMTTSTTATTIGWPPTFRPDDDK